MATTDDGLPDTLAELGRTCEGCGATLESDQAHRLVDGECPGCRYGSGWRDG